MRWSPRTVFNSRGWRPALAVAGALALASALAACSGNQVVASTSQQFYARVPSGWKVFEAPLLKHSSLESLISTKPQFLEVASASPRPRATDAFTSSRYPWAIAMVRPLSSAEQSQLSLESMSDVLVPVDELSQLGDNVQLLSQPTEQVNGPLHGIVLSVQLQGPSGGEIAYQQSTWVNGATNKIWLLMVGCSPSCYQQQQTAISSVMSSFLVPDNKGK